MSPCHQGFARITSLGEKGAKEKIKKRILKQCGQVGGNVGLWNVLLTQKTIFLGEGGGDKPMYTQ